MGVDSSSSSHSAADSLSVRSLLTFCNWCIFQDKVVEGEVSVDPKHHKHFVARRGEVLHEITNDYGGVLISFPRAAANSSRVVLKGAKDCVEGAKQRILEIVEDLESMVTIECVIPQKHHRHIMGAKGVNVQGVTSQYGVQIKFPARGLATGEEEPEVNGTGPAAEDGVSPPTSPRKCDVILITGKKENAEGARQALEVSACALQSTLHIRGARQGFTHKIARPFGIASNCIALYPPIRCRTLQCLIVSYRTLPYRTIPCSITLYRIIVCTVGLLYRNWSPSRSK